MKKQDVLNSVSNSVSSIFSKEDVIRLIESIEVGNEVQIEDALSTLYDTLDRASSNNALVEWSTAEFALNGNEITLENVDVDVAEIVNMVREILEEIVEKSN
jgi:hypothetical protein